VHSFYELDAKIAALEAQIIQLKSQRNGVTWICRLPSKILTRIFEHLQDRRLGGPNEPRLSYIDTSWVRIMAVCQHFRAVAMEAPCLWNIVVAVDRLFGISDKAKRWNDLCVARSGSATLDVIATVDHGARFISLAKTAYLQSNPRKRDTMTDILDQAAPHLRCLGTKMSHLITSSFLGGTNTSLVDLFLHALHGDHIQLQDVPFMPSLRRLTLYGVTIASGIQLLARLLEHITHLEEFHVDSLLFNVPRLIEQHTVMPVAKRVQLSRLERLTIRDTPVNASALLRLVSIPATTLSVSVIQDVHARDNSLDDNHLQIHEEFLAFRRQALQITEPCDGLMRLQCMHPNPHPGVLTFRAHPNDTNEDMLGSYLCYAGCKLSGTHSLLSHITVLCLIRMDEPNLHVPSIDEALGVRFLPAVQKLILDRFQTPKDLEPVNTWLARRKDQIKQIELVYCSETIRSLVSDSLSDLNVIMREGEAVFA
jgi:hypothetical protein